VNEAVKLSAPAMDFFGGNRSVVDDRKAVLRKTLPAASTSSLEVGPYSYLSAWSRDTFKPDE